MTQPAPEAEPDLPGVIAPPPLIYAAMLALALGADFIVGGPSIDELLGLPDQAVAFVGAVLFGAGIALPVAAIFRFRAAGTEVIPYRPASALVTTGVYRFTRNPMYLGMTLVYAGLSLIADSVIALAGLVPLIIIVTYGVIQREERYLDRTFGQSYRAYRSKVRRWI
jgi:protein-S-isoprenylcysteine O-methyltransferase Ste14